METPRGVTTLPFRQTLSTVDTQIRDSSGRRLIRRYRHGGSHRAALESLSRRILRALSQVEAGARGRYVENQLRGTEGRSGVALDERFGRILASSRRMERPVRDYLREAYGMPNSAINAIELRRAWPRQYVIFPRGYFWVMGMRSWRPTWRHLDHPPVPAR